MRTINGRFEIVSLLNENSNFIVYEITDRLAPRKEKILKITVSEERFQTDLLRKEFLAGLMNRHPLLRPLESFHTLRTIDGRFTDSSRCFYVAEKYPELYRARKDKAGVLVNALYTFLGFLHRNRAYHGDLRESNILADSQGLPLFFDMSPLYVNSELGQKNDRNAVVEIMRSLGFPFHSEDEERLFSLPGFHSLISDDYVKAVTLEHIRTTPFPAERFLQNRHQDGALLSHQVNVIYDYRDSHNARIWYDGIMSLIQTEGYELYRAEGEGTLSQRLTALFHEGEGSEELLGSLEDAAGYGPLAIGLGAADRMSGDDLRLLQRLSRHFDHNRVCFFAWQREPADEFESLSLPLLTEEETIRTLEYYLPFLDRSEETANRLWSQSEGEPSLLCGLIRHMAARDCLDFRNAAVFLKERKDCFDFSLSVREIPVSIRKAAQEVVALIRAMGGKAPISFYHFLSQEEKEALAYLLDEKAVYRDRLFFILRINRIPATLLKNRGEMPESRTFVRELEKLAFQEKEFLESYVFYSLTVGLGHDAYVKVMDFYNGLTERERSLDRPLFFRLFRMFDKNSSALEEGKCFDLYFHLLKLDYNHLYENTLLLEKLEKNASTEKERHIVKAMRLTLDDKTTLDDVKEMLSLLKENKIEAETWPLILRHVLLKLKFLGFYEEMEKLMEEYRPLIDSLDDENRVMIMNEMFSCYMDKMNLEKMQEAAQAMLETVEKKKESTGLDAHFSSHNNLAIVLRRQGRLSEALDHYNKALEIARLLENYRYEAIVATNIGVIHYYSGDYEACTASWTSAVKAAEQARIYFSMVTNSINLSLVFKLLHQYKQALATFKKIELYLAEAPTVRENSKLHLLYADMLMELGDFQKADIHLTEAAHFYEERDALKVSYEYFNVKASLLFQKDGKEAMDDFIDDLFSRFSSEEDRSYYSLILLTAALQSLCSGNMRDAADYVNRISSASLETLEPGDRQVLDVIRFLTGESEEFAKEVLGEFTGYSRSMFILHALIMKEDGKSPLHLEYCAQLLSIMNRWLNHIPYEYRESFMMNNLEWRFHHDLLQGLGYEIEGFSLDDFRRNHSSTAQRYMRREKSRALKNYRLSPMGEGEALYRSILKDLLRITGMTRAAYFEYDMYEGWQQKVLLDLGTGYHPPLPVNKEAISDVLFESSHREIAFRQESGTRGPSVSAVMVIPVLDIEKLGHNKFRGDEKRQSSFHYFALRGCLYLDSDRMLLVPDGSVTEGLGPLRDYINAAGYYDYLKQTALMDKLTGLYKREHWLNLTKNLMDYALNNDQQVIIAILDIDHFKNINDRYGHARGDAVLKDVSARIKETVRATDIVGRYGGEEIVLAMMVPPKSSSSGIIDRVRADIQNSALNKKFNLTVSIGYALYPRDAELLDTLLGQADEALYYAKSSGRNVTIAFETMPEHMAGEKDKSKKAIDDPVREKEKLDALLALQEKIDPLKPVAVIISDIYDILVSLFQATRLAIVLGGNGHFHVYEKKASAQGVETRETDSDSGIAGSKVNTYVIHEHYSVSVYLEIESDRYSIQKDTRFFTMLGNMISEKVFLASFHTVQKE